MKKSLIALFSVMVVLVFTASAFALHAVPQMYEYQPQVVKSKKAQVEIGGSIRIRGEANNNLTDQRDTQKESGHTVAADFDDSASFYDQRVRLNINATVSPKTMGAVELESGDGTVSDGQTWGNTGTTDAGGVYRRTGSNSKQGWVTIRQAYIAHQGKDLGILSGWKAGHMLLGLGNGIFYDHTKYGDDAIVLWLSPADGMELSFLTIKMTEGVTAFSDDTDAYVGTFATKAGPANISADITYLNDHTTITDTATTFGETIQLTNIGVRTDVKAGPATIRADIEYQTGTAKDFKRNKDNLKLQGNAIMLGVDIAAGPVTITVEGARGSGDKPHSKDHYTGYLNSISSGQHYTYVYDQKVETSGQFINANENVGGAASGCADIQGNADGCSSNITAGAMNTGLNNTRYLNLGVAVKPVADLKLDFDFYVLQATEPVAINGATDNEGKPAASRDLGTEVDAKIEYQIDTNLVWYVESGVMFVGDAYDRPKHPTRSTLVGARGHNVHGDAAWSVRNGVILSF
ncbi:MAG: hypothetical protein HY757_08245 [Nitrospirae bacterium]|nr:hypothetical protein [Nitrospirota bacterium]